MLPSSYLMFFQLHSYNFSYLLIYCLLAYPNLLSLKSQVSFLTFIFILCDGGASHLGWCLLSSPSCSRLSLDPLIIKNIPLFLLPGACNVGDPSSIPGSGRSGEGNGNPLQSSCLENPMGGGAWWATVQRVGQDWAISRLSSWFHHYVFFF